MATLIVRYELIARSARAEERIEIQTTLQSSQAEALREIAQAAAAALVSRRVGTSSSEASDGHNGIQADPDSLIEFHERGTTPNGGTGVGVDGEHVPAAEEEFVSSHLESSVDGLAG